MKAGGERRERRWVVSHPLLEATVFREGILRDRDRPLNGSVKRQLPTKLDVRYFVRSKGRINIA